MAPVANRLTMLATGSTSSSRTGGPRPLRCGASESTPRMRSSPRSVISRRDWSSTSVVYSWKTSYRRLRVACCSLNTVSGPNRCGSPVAAPLVLTAGVEPPVVHAGAGWRVAWPVRRPISAASSSKLTPPSREVVPAKHLEITSGPRPMDSKICAPV